MDIKLSRTDILSIVEQVVKTDRADPFGEREYLIDFVEARILDALPRRIRPSEQELRRTAEMLLEVEALACSYALLSQETQTARIVNSMGVINELVGEKTAEILA